MTIRRSFSGLADTRPARGWNPLTLALLAGLWIAALPHWPLWRALLTLPETSSTRGALFVIGFGVMVAALTALLLTLLAWRPTIKPAIAVMLLAAAFGAHFMGSYGVVIDTTMMVNVLQTDPREVRDLLNLQLLGSVLLVALYADFSATMRNHRTIRCLINPVNSVVRGVTNFRQVMSCGTSTATSLPCMFSSLGKAGYESRSKEQENLLDLVQHAGMAVLWVDNQGGCKGLCARVPSAHARDAVAGVPALPAALCKGQECLDEALLHGLDARMAALPLAARERGVLLVLHQMGSHGPAYFKRSPPERKPFQPECTTNVLQRCDTKALVNAYDNSIAYTDHVLSQTIGWLTKQEARHDTALLYLSDHGESLGENNLYLDGLPYAVAPVEQKHVPMVLWQGPQARAQSGCLAALRDAPLTHDNLFHSTLGLLGIRATEYKQGLDAFVACRAP